MPRPQTETVRSSLLRALLKQVSRSFYLTVKVLPASVRDQIGLSYLFARAADTIADTDLLDRARRLAILKQFRGLFAGRAVNRDEIHAIRDELASRQTVTAERRLLERLDDCFRVYEGFSADDQQRIRQLMGTLPNGMEMDLTVFPGESAKDVTALRSLEDLDRYTYYVAGCVGEFWTAMMCAHRPALTAWDPHHMSAVGVRFGKGLQLTNILKDLARDLQRGRCYVPEPMLREAGLTPADLLRPERLPAFRPVLRRLLRLALEHLDQGWLYTMAIPRSEVRLRLACMWPILFAGATLERVATSPDLLNPAVTVKMSKGQVYHLMAVTTLTAGSRLVGTAYWGHLRKQVV